MFATTTALLGNNYLGHLLAYLDLQGWKIADKTRKWYELHGSQDINGTPLTLVLPSNPNLSRAEDYIEKAVSLLNAIADEPLEITVQRIQNYYSDIFVVSNPETGAYQSIPIGLAATQITKLKMLIVNAARTERNPQPFFHKPASSSDVMLDRFQFGHTVKGSFGFTVEAPIVSNLEFFKSESPQLPLLSNLDDYINEAPISRPPIERRIMERIIRGLQITNRATSEHSINPIVNEYGSGFSGNMCNAIIDISDDGYPIEYRVLWSPKVKVSEDIAGFSSIKLNKTSYDYLKEAIAEMKDLKPEFEVVRGTVTHIGSTVAPLSEENGGRSVILRRIFEDDRRSHAIIVPLSKDQYLQAYKAHLDWSTIEVTGIVERVGSSYRLVDARDLRVVNPPAQQ